MSDNVVFTEEQQQILERAPVPDSPGKVTFYCAIEGKGSNQRIPIGGARQKDSNGRILQSDFRLAEFTEGICRTDDPVKIAVLRRMASDPATGITEDREAYLDKVVPPERQVKRLEQQLAESRAETNRLRERLSQGGNVDAPKTTVTQGPVSSGSVPRRRGA